MAKTNNKYNWYVVLENTCVKYSPGNMNLIKIFIEIEGTQNEWFLLRWINDKPEMWRGTRHGLLKREQQGPELEKEKNNLGKVEVEKVGDPLRPFHDYNSFWKEISHRGE